MGITNRIAIVGAGLAGLATAWHLRSLNVTLFDPCGIGGGASAVTAGLLHTYAGLHAKLNWRGLEGYLATKELLEVAGPNCFVETGLLRLALTKENESDFQKASEKFEDVEWLSPSQCQKIVPHATFKPGIFIKTALTIYGNLYLEGMWKALQQYVSLEKKAVNNLNELSSFDKIVLTAGYASKNLLDIPLFPVKGQLLELEWPSDIPPLPLPLASQAYIVMSPGNKTCLAGTTFEHTFSSSQPDEEVAAKLILPKIVELFPPLENAKIVNVRAGIRASTPDHKPILRQIDSKTYLLAGLGSKGLLYHALYGKELAKIITLSCS